MPRLRRWLGGLAGIVFLALLAAWLVPQWLDWTRYRTMIEVVASATLGQPVSIRGPITLGLLPLPTLTAAEVSVGENKTTDQLIHLDALRLRVALWPLIGGRFDAHELVLRGPDLHLPWPTQSGMLRMRPPAWLGAFAARMENGRLTVGRLAFSDIDATVTSLQTGAMSASGTARFSGLAWRFTALLTAAGADGASGLNVTLDGQGKASGLGASIAGQLAADGTLAGTISGRGPNIAALLPAPSVPFRVDGRLTVGSGLAALDDLSLDFGGSRASGAVALRVAPQQRLDIKLSASQLDLDAWLPALARAGTTIAGTDVPVGLELSAEAAPMRGGTLERVTAAFDLIGNDLVIRQASAQLPGDGMLQLSGRVTRGNAAYARFEGDAKLDAPALRTTLRWLDRAVPGALPPGLPAGLPDGVLQRAELSAHLVAADGDVSLRHLAGGIDDAPISGSIGLKRGDRPILTADLALERLSLGPWLPIRQPGLADLSRLVSGLDAELRFGVQRATWAGSTIDGLAVDVAIKAGSIQLRQVAGTTRGARVMASGVLGEGGRLSEGVLSLVTPDATPLAEMLPSAWRATPALWHGPAKLELQAAGQEDALAVGVRLALADARFEAKPIFNLLTGEWSGTLTVRHPGARRLIVTLGLPEQLGLLGPPAWPGDGSLSLVAHLAATKGRLGAETFELTMAALHASGNLMLDQSGTEPHVTGLVHVDSVPFALPNGRSDVPLPFGLLHNWQGDLRVEIERLVAGFRPVLRDASAVLTVSNGDLRIDAFTAKLGSGTVSGKLALDAAAPAPSLSVEATLSDCGIAGPLADAPIDLLSGRAGGNLWFSASGYSPSAIVATLGGRAALTITDGVLSGFDLFRTKRAVETKDPRMAEAAARDALITGSTGFDRFDLSASLAHGDLSLDGGLLSGAAGEARFIGGANLVAQTLDLRIAIQTMPPNPPEIGLRFTGPLDHPVRTPELDNLARWMAEIAHW